MADAQFLEINTALGSLSADRDVLARGIVESRTKGAPPVSHLAAAMTTVNITDTIDGASTLAIGLVDDDWKLIDSGFFDVNENGRLDPIDVNYPHGSDLWWRTTQLDIDGTASGATLTLTFVERAAAQLMMLFGPLSANRDKVTRAEFIGSLVAKAELTFHSGELHDDQKITGLKRTGVISSKPGKAIARKRSKRPGIHPGQVIVIPSQHYTLTAGEKGNAERVLDEAFKHTTHEKALLALCEACIVEAPNFRNPSGGDASSSGILQLLASTAAGKHVNAMDIEAVVRLFLLSGFTGQGGAIALARQHAGWTAGQVAQAVQGSAYPDRYQAVLQGAKNVLAAFGGAGVEIKNVLYIGDSLGVGTEPHLARRMSRRKFTARVKGSMSSAWGVQQLRDAWSSKFDAVVFDMGTNDTSGDAVTSAIRDVKKIVGSTPIFMATVNAPAGQDAAFNVVAKNAAINGSGVVVVDWRAVSGRYLSGGNVHPSAAGYAARARLFANAIESAVGSGDGSVTVRYAKAYNFRVGKRESYWTAAVRLAEEVNWRLFVDGDDVYYDSEMELIRQKPVLVVERGDPSLLSFRATWDSRHIATSCELSLVCDPLEFRAGEVVKIGESFGPAGTGSTAKLPGRWLIDTIDRDRFSLSATITLKQPSRPKPEPAPEYVEKSLSTGTGTDGSTGPDGKYTGKGKVIVVAGANRPGASMQPPILEFLKIASGHLKRPIYVSTGTNHNQFVAGTSRQSDHWDGNAGDLGSVANHFAVGGVGGGWIATACLLAATGITVPQARAWGQEGTDRHAAMYDLSWHGHRVQVLWKTAGHYDHVHVGVA